MSKYADLGELCEVKLFEVPELHDVVEEVVLKIGETNDEVLDKGTAGQAEEEAVGDDTAVDEG